MGSDPKYCDVCVGLDDCDTHEKSDDNARGGERVASVESGARDGEWELS